MPGTAHAPLRIHGVAVSERIGPAIDDEYWFAWSKELVDSAFTRRDAALDRLQKLILWLWAIYTTFAATGFALADKELDTATALTVGSASVVLILVYWSCVWAQMPIPVDFDPRSPTEIRAAHHALVKKKDRRMVVTVVLSLIAAALVAVALLVAGAAPSG